MSDTPARPTFAAPEAVAATGKSRRQIGRMLAAGELVGAHKIAGEWQIPLEALLAAGLRFHAPSPPDTTSSAERDYVDLQYIDPQELALAAEGDDLEVAKTDARGRGWSKPVGSDIEPGDQ